MFDSVFRLNAPFDLVNFLDQESRVQEVMGLYKEMIKWKKKIDEQWSQLDSTSMSVSNLYASDPDCSQISSHLDLYASVAATAADRISSSSELGIQEEDEEDDEVEELELDCGKVVPLEFSMATFPHLQVLSQPWNISWASEADLELPMTVNQISRGLARNRTSWFFHNLASLHWRKIGDGQRALDCAKRSLHFASRSFKDVPLLNLGVMLQRAQCSAEAAILLHSAVDHAPHRPQGHFVLANVYAVLGDYNRSIGCYDNALGLDPDWTQVKSTKHAVLCRKKLEQLFLQLNSFLQDIMTQLKDYSSVYERWLKTQEEVLKHKAPLPSPPLSSLSETCNSDPTTDDMGCGVTSLTSSAFHLTHLHFDFTLSLQLLLDNAVSLTNKINEQMAWILQSISLESALGQTNTQLKGNNDEDTNFKFEEDRDIIDNQRTNLHVDETSNFSNLQS